MTDSRRLGCAGVMRIAVAQVCSTPHPDENLALMRSALADAPGADLVVFPEGTQACFARRSSEVAEPLDGPFANGVRSLAAEFKTNIAVGMFTPSDDEARCRNTLFLTGPAGETSYDKLHLFDAFGFKESDHVAPGDRLAMATIADTTVGLAICYDVRFPELFKAYARAGADVIILPASWADGPTKVDQWRLLVRARALDSTTHVVACGQAEPAASGRPVSNAPLGVGHSLVVAPDGTILHEADAAPSVFMVDIDPDAIASARTKIPVLANSRFGVALNGLHG